MRTKEELKQLEAEKEVLRKEIEASLKEGGIVKLNNDMLFCLLKTLDTLFVLQRNDNLQRIGFYKVIYHLFKYLTMHNQLSAKQKTVDVIFGSFCYELVYDLCEVKYGCEGY